MPRNSLRFAIQGFSSTSSLCSCRSTFFFRSMFCRQENFFRYLISTECWSLTNQNKNFLSLETLRLSFSLRHFTLSIRSFSLKDFFFLSVYFQKRIWLDSRGPLLFKSNVLSSELPEVSIRRCSRTFRYIEIHFLGVWKNI